MCECPEFFIAKLTPPQSCKFRGLLRELNITPHASNLTKDKDGQIGFLFYCKTLNMSRDAL